MVFFFAGDDFGRFGFCHALMKLAEANMFLAIYIYSMIHFVKTVLFLELNAELVTSKHSAAK